jgi:hypothetical protein
LETLERIEALVPKPHYSKRVEIINELLAAGLLAALTACLNAATRLVVVFGCVSSFRLFVHF